MTDMADLLVQAAKRATIAKGGEWDEFSARTQLAAACWELAAWGDRRNPEIQLAKEQRGALRDLADKIDKGA